LPLFLEGQMMLRTLFGVIAAAAIAAPLATTRAQGQTPSGGPQKACTISTDPDYGLSPSKPVRVGGGALYVAARERRYLEALRGPAGQQISFKRLGQTRPPGAGPNSLDIIDDWQITYEGLEKPISIYIDAYRYGEPRAPVGFTCVPFTLGPPPIDGFLASDQLVHVAIAQGTTREFSPIPLGADARAPQGVAFDRFRRIALAARAAAAAGKPMDPKEPPKEIMGMGLVLLAYPLACGERRVAPAAIDVVPRQGQPVKNQGGPVSGNELASLVPGFTAPEGSIAVRVGLAILRPVDTVRITYASETCDGTSKDVTIPVTATPMRGVEMPQPPLPPGADPPEEPVWLQVLVDHEGVLQQATYVGGPERLAAAAIEGVRAWRADPARINGAPVTAESLVVIRFR
jgi:hypothetical protein